MFDWLIIQTLPETNNSGKWLARWRWDNYWVVGHSRKHAIMMLKERSV